MQEINQNKFNQYLKGKGLSNRTVFEYNKYLGSFDCTRLNQDYANAFAIKFKNHSIVRAFINNLLGFIQYSQDFPPNIKAECLKVKLLKVTGRKKKRLPDVVSKEDVHAMAEATKNTRNRLMLLISFYGGLRVAELVGDKFNPDCKGVCPYSFNWNKWTKTPEEDGKLKVIGKGNQERIVFIPSWLMKTTYQWIINDVSKKQKKDECLFKVKANTWEKILYKISAKTIGRKIHCHTLRHACATYLTDTGWTLQEVADYLGHDSIVTTQIYAHINREKLQEKFKKSQA